MAKMSKIKKIGICCPVFNEEENIEDFYLAYSSIAQELQNEYEIEFLFADNSSTDKSFQIIKNIAKKNIKVRGIKYSKNFGVMKSIYTCIIKSPNNWDSLAVFDCDMQDPPSLLKSLLKQQEKGYRIVYGERISRDESNSMSTL